MGAGCGLTTTLRAARDFVSRYLLMAKAAIRLCRKIALEPLTTFTPTTRRVESVVDRVLRPWPRQFDGGSSVPETHLQVALAFELQRSYVSPKVSGPSCPLISPQSTSPV